MHFLLSGVSALYLERKFDILKRQTVTSRRRTPNDGPSRFQSFDTPLRRIKGKRFHRRSFGADQKDRGRWMRTITNFRLSPGLSLGALMQYMHDLGMWPLDCVVKRKKTKLIDPGYKSSFLCHPGCYYFVVSRWYIVKSTQCLQMRPACGRCKKTSCLSQHKTQISLLCRSALSLFNMLSLWLCSSTFFIPCMQFIHICIYMGRPYFYVCGWLHLVLRDG